MLQRRQHAQIHYSPPPIEPPWRRNENQGIYPHPNSPQFALPPRPPISPLARDPQSQRQQPESPTAQSRQLSPTPPRATQLRFRPPQQPAEGGERHVTVLTTPQSNQYHTAHQTSPYTQFQSHIPKLQQRQIFRPHTSPRSNQPEQQSQQPEQQEQPSQEEASKQSQQPSRIEQLRQAGQSTQEEPPNQVKQKKQEKPKQHRKTEEQEAPKPMRMRVRLKTKGRNLK
ncbi:putative uncharacterized protein DDB_G0294196 [Ceratitis capitata]|uniref:putative uncharacterized protein DDB_G0294196 n=1 Tax=Ceratitis capitata TaxID=7213 RepID=UPI00032A3706|nr:putative uncharacterized protein DDB_G0294196 [Ceratitis capitata]